MSINAVASFKQIMAYSFPSIGSVHPQLSLARLEPMVESGICEIRSYPEQGKPAAVPLLHGVCAVTQVQHSTKKHDNNLNIVIIVF